MALSVELHKKFKGFQMDVAFEHDGAVWGFSVVPVWARA